MNKTVFGYFGELNPLSNFFPAPFTYKTKMFHSSEQFIQLKKTELFKDKSVLKKIEESSTSHQCKQDGQRISKFNHETWEKMPTGCASRVSNKNFLRTKSHGNSF